MPLSQFPFGFSKGVTIAGLQIVSANAGNVLYVDSNTGNDGNDGSIGRPLASIAGAFTALTNLATRGARIGNTLNGALILLKPYHAETLTAATTYSQASVAIVGISNGDGDIPTITLTTAAGAGISLGAADMMIKNVKIVDNQGVTVALKLTKKGCIADNVRVVDGSASFTTGISIVGGGSNLADRSRVTNCYIQSAGATNGILLGELNDQIEVTDNLLLGSFSTAAVQNPTATVLTNLKVHRNYVSNTHASGKGFNFVSACTGAANDNRVKATVLGNEWVASTAMSTLGNKGSSTAGTSEYTVPLGVSAEPVVAVSAIKALPQTTTATVVTIAGGAVVLEALIGEVTTAIQNQANNTKFTYTDTASSTSTDICAVTSTANLAVGTLFYPKLDAAATALVTAAGGAAFAEQGANGLILMPGTVVINCAASNTGNVKYHLRYRPLQPGASATLA